MKKILVLIFIFFQSTHSISAQGDRDSPTVDIFGGYATGSHFLMGLSMRNTFGKIFGMYYDVEGLNTVQSGVSGDEHFDSSYPYITSYDSVISDIPPWGMNMGLTWNLDSLFHKKNLGLTALIGVGFAVSQKQLDVNSVRTYSNQYLSPTYRYSSEPYEKKTVPTLDFILMYDLVDEGMVGFGVLGGYNTNNGVLFGISVGLRMSY